MNWISVKDRLPEVGTSKKRNEVLIYDAENEEVMIGIYLYSQPTFPVFGIFGRGQVFEITHWQPLPKPPKITRR
jgi:hypothetical protein